MSENAMSKSPVPYSEGWNVFVSGADRMLVKEALGRAQTFYRAVTYIPAVKWFNPDTRLQLFLYLPISRRVELLENKVRDISRRVIGSGDQPSMAGGTDGVKRMPSFAVERCVVWPSSLFRNQISKDFLTCLIDCGINISVFPREHLKRLKGSMSATAYEIMETTREFFVIDVPSAQSDPRFAAWWGDGVTIKAADGSESGYYADIFDALWKEGAKLKNDDDVARAEIHLTKLMRSWD